MAVTGDTASGSNAPKQQAQSEESIQNTWHLHERDFQRSEEGISESLVDEHRRETVNDKTTEQQANIYSTPCKRITKKPLSCCSQQGQQENCGETLKFEYPNSTIDTVVLDPKLQTNLSLLKWTQNYKETCKGWNDIVLK